MNSTHPLMRLERQFGRLLRGFSIACLVAITLLLVVNIASRATGLFAMNWFDEVIATLFAWLVFIGACALWREREHFSINLLGEALAGSRLSGLHQLAVALLGLLFAAVLMYYGALFVERTGATTPVLELPQSWVYACMPVAGLVMTGYALRDVWVAVRDLLAGRTDAVGTEVMAPPPVETH
ncbi:TRAP transporter small permease [Xylophilus sp. GOD-11R]|uniref:TRAP transporter small permease n=1 Tax=Xylophilus sp. GOD-11R TaxID=3089814 RepID=UPI00298CABA2|nr:TRAP transporter small permease subunit [Xylophilus sp. GOD-11R]WPB58426.1 TRAP transporter small permease subunit [Xylophilus sp. GOD-11R]